MRQDILLSPRVNSRKQGFQYILSVMNNLMIKKKNKKKNELNIVCLAERVIQFILSDQSFCRSHE